MQVSVDVLESRNLFVRCYLTFTLVFFPFLVSFAKLHCWDEMAGTVRDPDPMALQGMSCMGHAMSFAGMMGEMTEDHTHYPGPLATSFLNALGVTLDTAVEVVAENPQGEIDEAIRGMNLTDGLAVRPFTLGEKGTCRLTIRYIRLKLGQVEAGGEAEQFKARLAVQADEINELRSGLSSAFSMAATASSAALSASSAGQASQQQQQQQTSSEAAGADKAVALKEYVSQTKDTTCRKLSAEEIRACYAKYKDHFGKTRRPPPNEDPSEDQLAALRHMLEVGENPYCDFAIWKPHSQRTIKQQKTTGQVFDADAKLVTVEILGPPTFAQWKASYTILANGLFMLGAVDIGNLDEYRKYHERCHDRFGEKIYALQYQADVRTRQEEFVRILRDGETSYAMALAKMGGDVSRVVHDFEPSRPWNYVFENTFDTLKANKWWHEELEYQALAIINSSVAVSDVLGGDARIGTRAPPQAPPGIIAQQAGLEEAYGAHSARRPRPWEAEARADIRQPEKKLRLHNVKDGNFTTSRKGKPLCAAFQLGTCGMAIREGNMCPANPKEIHLCKLCLSAAHGACGCDRTEAPANPPDNFNGLGKGRGKNGKGGKYGKGKGRGKSGKGWGGYRQW